MIIAKRSNKQQIINLLIANGAKGIEDLRKQKKLKQQQAAAAAQSELQATGAQNSISQGHGSG